MTTPLFVVPALVSEVMVAGNGSFDDLTADYVTSVVNEQYAIAMLKLDPQTDPTLIRTVVKYLTLINLWNSTAIANGISADTAGRLTTQYSTNGAINQWLSAYNALIEQLGYSSWGVHLA